VWFAWRRGAPSSQHSDWRANVADEAVTSVSPFQPAPPEKRKGQALCLSGGGFRAALFHLGALRRLNEVGLLSKLATITSVSGGSVANGLLARYWMDSKPKADALGRLPAFDTYEAALRAFCSRDIRTGPLLTERLDPRNWPLLLGDDHSATDLLAQQYRDHLVGDLRLKDLVAVEKAGSPKFVFNSSGVQTGVDFVFSGDRVGDWKIGHASMPDVLVADAIAASSAFPIAFPPLVLKFEPGTFQGGALEGKPGYETMSRRVVLTDGGVYDNLGLEPVWKSHVAVLCSDGGKPFGADAAPAQGLPGRLLRVQDIIGNQAIAIRKRWLVASFEKKVYRGTYWGIGTEIEGYKTRGPGYGETVLGGLVLDRLRAVRTDFNTFSEAEQLILMNHGWTLADAALRTYMPDALPNPVPAGSVPSTDFLEHPDRAAEALRASDKHV
jgi:NTE family protein